MIKFKVEKMRHQGGHHSGLGRHPLHNLFRQAFRGGCQPEGLFARGPHHGWHHRSRWLSRGAVGDAVKEIQQALGVQVDGFFGAKTEQAVKDFQTAQSLDADGIVGPRTRAKLIPTTEKKDVEKDSPCADRHSKKASWWLSRGAMGDAVKEIQQALGIQADGIFGPRTEQAVKEFQAAHGLDADGIVGPRTRAKIPTEKKDASVPATAPESQSQAAPESPALTQLINMGFPDVSLNAQLLKKHHGDVEQAIAELIGA